MHKPIVHCKTTRLTKDGGKRIIFVGARRIRFWGLSDIILQRTLRFTSCLLICNLQILAISEACVYFSCVNDQNNGHIV